MIMTTNNYLCNMVKQTFMYENNLSFFLNENNYLFFIKIVSIIRVKRAVRLRRHFCLCIYKRNMPYILNEQLDLKMADIRY